MKVLHLVMLITFCFLAAFIGAFNFDTGSVGIAVSFWIFSVFWGAWFLVEIARDED